jgi:hypothetical protein
MGFNNPTPKTEDLYIKSINTTTDSYNAMLVELRTGKLELPNYDLDDGITTKAGEYSLADETYAKLLARLAANHFDQTTAQLRDNILDFYADPSLPMAIGKDSDSRLVIQTDLTQLKAQISSPAIVP